LGSTGGPGTAKLRTSCEEARLPQFPEIHTRRAALEDVEVAYTEIEGADPALVLVHGFTGHRDDFLPQLPALWEGQRILVPDLRGHGDSTHGGQAERFRFEQLVEDLRRFLAGREVARCDLIGHSLGGMVSLRFALAHPERLRSLLLMDTSPSAPDGYSLASFEKAGAIAEARGMAFLQQRVERAARAERSSRPADRQAEKWADAYWPHHRRRYRSMDPAGYEPLGRAMLTQRPVVERLGEIACPVTVMVGLDDESFLAGADALMAGIPHAIRVDLADAGHHPHRESTGAWLAAVREHRRRVAGD
jgi:pimeloyl-ACP methyl ester carboxylesterase